jgi:hypothetical protein
MLHVRQAKKMYLMQNHISKQNTQFSSENVERTKDKKIKLTFKENFAFEVVDNSRTRNDL